VLRKQLLELSIKLYLYFLHKKNNMKQKFTYLFLFVMLCHAQVLFAQVDGDYRSITSGNWATTTTWETFSGGSWIAASAAPQASDGVITIRNGHTVTVAAVAGADQLVIQSGGILTNTAAFTLSDGAGTDLDIQSGGTVNIGAALNVSGVIDNAGTINWSAGNIAFTIWVQALSKVQEQVLPI
jgi:hypothetical protein